MSLPRSIQPGHGFGVCDPPRQHRNAATPPREIKTHSINGLMRVLPAKNFFSVAGTLSSSASAPAVGARADSPIASAWRHGTRIHTDDGFARWISSPGWRHWCPNRGSTSSVCTACLRRTANTARVTPARRGSTDHRVYRRSTEIEKILTRLAVNGAAVEASRADRCHGAVLTCALSGNGHHRRC